MSVRTVRSDDGSCTAYSAQYGEHYHSTKDGALTESLRKHVLPAYACQRAKSRLNILDICFGLGFNTLATLMHYAEHAPETSLRIFSPELDAALIASLTRFEYPDCFSPYRRVIEALVHEGEYQDERLFIQLYTGDAREYVRRIDEGFDIVYQDAFSPAANPALWTKEYLADVAARMKDDAVLSTYSTALKTRLALHENGLNVYLNRGEGYRNATLASKSELIGFERVDMAHKIACNPDVRALSDFNIVK